MSVGLLSACFGKSLFCAKILGVQVNELLVIGMIGLSFWIMTSYIYESYKGISNKRQFYMNSVPYLLITVFGTLIVCLSKRESYLLLSSLIQTAY